MHGSNPNRTSASGIKGWYQWNEYDGLIGTHRGTTSINHQVKRLSGPTIGRDYDLSVCRGHEFSPMYVKPRFLRLLSVSNDELCSKVDYAAWNQDAPN